MPKKSGKNCYYFVTQWPVPWKYNYALPDRTLQHPITPWLYTYTVELLCILCTIATHLKWVHYMDLFNNFVSFHASLANNWTVNKLFTDFKKVYNSVRREGLYFILIKFGIIMKLLRFIKMHLNEMCSKVCTHKHLSDTFPFQKTLKQVDLLSPLLSNFALVYAIRRPKQTRRKGI